MAPVDLNQWMDFEFNKPRRMQWLKEMGWDEAAIDKMFGITRSPGGFTLTDARPFSAEKAKHPWEGDISKSGISSAPREFNTPGTPPGLEPLRRRRGDPGYGVTSERGQWLHPPEKLARTKRALWEKTRLGRGGRVGEAIQSGLAKSKQAPPTKQGPENIIHQVRKVHPVPPGQARNPASTRPSPEMVKMMLNWENIVKGPKNQLAGQLTSFISKYGMAAIKFMAKLPK